MKRDIANRVTELVSDIRYLKREINEIEDIQRVMTNATNEEVLTMAAHYEKTKGYFGDFLRATFADFLVKKIQEFEEEIERYEKEIGEL